MNASIPECSNHLIGKSITAAFQRMWDMYREALEKIPENHWRTGNIDYLIPSRIIYHVLEGADFLSSPNPQDFAWGHRFNVRWEEASLKNLPTQESLQKYLDEMIVKVIQWIRNLSDSDFLAADRSFPWAGNVKLERALYLLAHCYQHLGEINAELRIRGLPRIVWR